MRRIIERLVLVLLAGSVSIATPAAACQNKSTAIGLSRIIEIDATGGPQLGRSHYRDQPPILVDGEVVLTFDDGPHPEFTRRILETLDEHCTKATFFMIGRKALANQSIVQEVQRKGHTIANHTWSHIPMPMLPLPRAIGEVEKTFSMLTRTAGRPVAPFFRFPGLAENKALRAHFQTRGIATIAIEVDSKDFAPGTTETDIVNRVLQGLAVEKKGIILLHDIHAQTMRATGPLLTELRKRGFRVVHLVAKSGITPLPGYEAR